MSGRLSAIDGLGEELLALATSGDEEAWRLLVRAVHPVVYRWALGMARDRDEADDVAQETLIRMQRHLGGFVGRSRLSVWLYRITANVAASRRRRAWWRRLGLDDAPELASAEPDPDARLDAARDAETVHTAFRLLPARQREVFDLADLQGYSPAEVAELLGMNPSTVRVHLLRARRAVRAAVLGAHPSLQPGPDAS